jgi:hypothetical protein
MSMQALRINYPTAQIGNQVDYERTKRLAFHDQEIVIINLNDPAPSWIDREELKRIATRKYGAKPMTLRPRR